MNLESEELNMEKNTGMDLCTNKLFPGTGKDICGSRKSPGL